MELWVTPSKPSSARDRLAVDGVAGAGQGARSERRDVGPASAHRPTGHGRARASPRTPAGGARRGPAAPAAGGCGRASPHRRGAAPSRPAARSRLTSAVSRSTSRRRSQSRRSVATWSLRDRPVCSLPATAPTLPARAISRLRCTSSRAGSQATVPLRTSSSRAASPPMSVTASAVRQQARPLQPAHVRPGAEQVVEGQLAVDVDGAPELGRQRIRRLAEAAAPGLHRRGGPAQPAAAHPAVTFSGASLTVTGSSDSSGCVQLHAEPWRAASVLSGSPKMRMKPTAAAWSKASSAS